MQMRIQIQVQILLGKHILKLTLNGVYDLNPYYYVDKSYKGKILDFEISNTNVAKIQSNNNKSLLITGLSNGIATLSISSEGKKLYDIEVNVNETNSIELINLNPIPNNAAENSDDNGENINNNIPTIKLNVGGEYTIKPYKYIHKDYLGKKISFHIEGNNSASMKFNKETKEMKITGLAQGSSVITFSNENKELYRIEVKVNNKYTPEGLRLEPIKDNIDSQVAQKSITDLLKAKHGKKDFFIMNTDTLKKTIESTTGTMKILISSIAVISLVVGGIGVMNIMLVSVTERTKEIGIRMAIGAKEKNILQQFLLEAVLICFIGGLVGIVLSLLIGWGFNSISKSFSMIFSVFSIVMAVLFSTLVGIIFGYMPAKNAAKLDPIEALSRE